VASLTQLYLGHPVATKCFSVSPVSGLLPGRSPESLCSLQGSPFKLPFLQSGGMGLQKRPQGEANLWVQAVPESSGAPPVCTVSSTPLRFALMARPSTRRQI
jgi:hypothetical protein